ncbi:receptor-like protein 6 [Corylus avellana]|uniref:receptor-like protein 6 n=1 Tax=Corylus avellana TaxID=13451 RepID=UPI00286B81CE|nr:receptor-like protein 6 [Corylus avellana]
MSTKLVKWNHSADCCSWEGVTCNEGRVIGLDLTNEFISGGLDNSSSLFSLQHLESLSLAYNDLNYSPEIPSEFDKLANLSYLNLSNVGFAGQIPIAISRLTRLVTLDLSTDYYIFQLKLENPNLRVLIQNLSELIELNLDGVLISAPGNEWCRALSSSLPNLRALSLSMCNLSGPIDSSLQNLQFLSIIDLSRNNFSALVPEFFADFKNLTSLEVSYSGLSGKFPNKIFQVPTLQTLDLSYNDDLQGSLPEFPPNGSLQTMVLCETSFSGTLPSSVGNLTMLSTIDLWRCNFVGSIPSTMASLTQLKYFDISNNKFRGPISNSMASLTQLKYLDFSHNKFSGSIPNFNMCKNLTTVRLSDNYLSSEIISIQWEKLLNLEILEMSSNLLNGSIPDSLFSHPSLQELDLSYNQFSGQLKEFSNASSFLESLYLDNNHLEGPIPLSISELHGLEALFLGSNKFNNSLNISVIQQLKNLLYLDLSHTSLLSEYNDFNLSLSSFPRIIELKLASCMLKNVPNFLRNLSSLSFIDLSNNQIHGEISTSIGQSFASSSFLFLSSNKFYGSIPISICNATNLQLLDLSNNSFSGTIPQCLFEMTGTLMVLDLRRNKLNATIPNAFPDNCGLQTLALNQNQLQGRLPKSLANCIGLEVLDIGNNHIEDMFPIYLKKTSMLSVLVLRSNKFYGSITHPELNVTWPRLQIVDIASNNFTGNLPIILPLSWTSMMDHGHEVDVELNYLEFNGNFSYKDTITITSKGCKVELVKIPTIVTDLDFSCNNFDGHIPRQIGELTLLYTLNLSHNAFTGEIPAALGKLSHLESLDLSSNELSGEIPVQLANGLIFLSVLNLSFNQLVGQIPLIKQFNTFSETSFGGNERLCGLPLKSKCTYEDPRLPPPTYEESHRSMIEWNYISAELGFVFGFGIVIAPLMFWRRWRIWYYKHVDDIMFRIFPQLS